MERSSNSIVEQTGFDKKRVLRALTMIGWSSPGRYRISSPVRWRCMKPTSVEPGGINGGWSEIREPARGKGTSKQPVFGILSRNGQVWAEIVDKVDEGTLHPSITQRVELGSAVCSDTPSFTSEGHGVRGIGSTTSPGVFGPVLIA
jgi:NADPH:quinone reductase-like Zn-dependent oxidoreductase